jgi:hypothetical protein
VGVLPLSPTPHWPTTATVLLHHHRFKRSEVLQKKYEDVGLYVAQDKLEELRRSKQAKMLFGLFVNEEV